MHAQTTEELRRERREIAEAIAPGWERRRADVERFAAPVREWLLGELGPGAGETVLELACGVGETGFEAARALGDDGHLISTDFSAGMLDAARRRGAELGVANAEYRMMDAEQIELDDDAVDGVLCRFGYMLMADPAKALAETRRVLRERGRLVLAVWGPPERNPYFTAVVLALVEAGHMPMPDPGEPGVFALAGAERTEALLGASGFGAVRIEEVAVNFALADVEGYLGFVADTAGPIGLALQRISEGDRGEVTARCQEALQRFATEDGLSIPGLALCAVAS